VQPSIPSFYLLISNCLFGNSVISILLSFLLTFFVGLIVYSCDVHVITCGGVNSDSFGLFLFVLNAGKSWQQG
jgi:hypothetical protein